MNSTFNNKIQIIEITLLNLGRVEEAIDLWDKGINRNLTSEQFYLEKVDLLIEINLPNINRNIRQIFINYKLPEQGDREQQEQLVFLFKKSLNFKLALLLIVQYYGQKTLSLLQSVGIKELRIIPRKSIITKKKVIENILLAIILKLTSYFSLSVNKLGRINELISLWDQGIKNNIYDDYYYRKKARVLQYFVSYFILIDELGRSDEVLECWMSGINNNKNQEIYYKEIQKYLLGSNRKMKEKEIMEVLDLGIKNNKGTIIFYQQKSTNIQIVKQTLYDTQEGVIRIQKQNNYEQVIECWQQGVNNSYSAYKKEFSSKLGLNNKLNLSSNLILVIRCNDYKNRMKDKLNIQEQKQLKKAIIEVRLSNSQNSKSILSQLKNEY